MNRLYLYELGVFTFALTFGFGGIASAEINLEESGIHVTGIDQVTVCVTPEASYAGNFIIRPRCDNINLRLKCGQGNNYRNIKPIMALDRAVGITCPPQSPCEDEQSCEDHFFDVVKVPDPPEALCVTCPVSSRFDLDPREMGIPINHPGKTRGCIIEGEFKTTGIRDPSPPDILYADPTYDRSGTGMWCLDEEGKVPLVEIEEALDPADVFFTFPKGGGRKPWMYERHPGQPFPSGFQPGPPDWSQASDKPQKIVHDPIMGSDFDGFLDSTEQVGFALTSDMIFVGGSHPQWSATRTPNCTPTLPDPNRIYCVHQSSQDLFAILHPLASDSYFPIMSSSSESVLQSFFGQIWAPADTQNGGLGITVHTLYQPDPEPDTDPRTVADGQMAVRIKEHSESLSLPIKKSTEIVLGTSGVGIPNDAGNTTIYSRKIKQYICDLCGGTPGTDGSCDGGNLGGPYCISATPTSATGDSLIREYVKYVNQHEIGHSLNLVINADPMYDYHHTPGDNTAIMTPSAAYTKRGSKVTFYLPYLFDYSCRNEKDLTD